MGNISRKIPRPRENQAWDVVTGTFTKPTDENDPEYAKKLRVWKDADSVAFLTIRKNCDEGVGARVGSKNNAKDTYDELRKVFEGKTATEFYALFHSISSVHFDDRKATIDEHIADYERSWNTFAGIISRASLTDDDGSEKDCSALQKVTKPRQNTSSNPSPRTILTQSKT